MATLLGPLSLGVVVGVVFLPCTRYFLQRAGLPICRLLRRAFYIFVIVSLVGIPSAFFQYFSKLGRERKIFFFRCICLIAPQRRLDCVEIWRVCWPLYEFQLFFLPKDPIPANCMARSVVFLRDSSAEVFLQLLDKGDKPRPENFFAIPDLFDTFLSHRGFVSQF